MTARRDAQYQGSSIKKRVHTKELNMEYQDFLKAKQSHVKPVGFDVDAGDINRRLFDWQAQMRGRMNEK